MIEVQKAFQKYFRNFWFRRRNLKEQDIQEKIERVHQENISKFQPKLELDKENAINKLKGWCGSLLIVRRCNGNIHSSKF